MDDSITGRNEPALGNARADIGAAVARVVAGSIPIAGPFLAELVTAVIPNQRLDRVEKFLMLLAEELSSRSAAKNVNQSSSVPLIEEGIAQAARAFTDVRKEYLARCVAEGVAAAEWDKLQELKVLRLLGELEDDDILLLDAVNDHDGWQKLRALQPARLPVNAEDKDRVKGELHRASYHKLNSLGLLTLSRYSDESRPHKYELPSGMDDEYYVSALGRLVLRRVGLLSSDSSA